MALGLACGQGWWRSCSAAAIFPGGGRRPVGRPGPAPPSRGARADGAPAAAATTPDPARTGPATAAAARSRSFVSGRK